VRPADRAISGRITSANHFFADLAASRIVFDTHDNGTQYRV
jgi:hypothetical protein